MFIEEGGDLLCLNPNIGGLSIGVFLSSINLYNDFMLFFIQIFLLFFWQINFEYFCKIKVTSNQQKFLNIYLTL